MKLALLVYLASVVEGISLIFGLIGFFGVVFYFPILALMHFSNYGIRTHEFEREAALDKQKAIMKSYTKYWKLAAVCFPLLLVLSILLPKERTIYLMAGAYATEQIATNDRVQKIGSDVLEVIEQKLAELKDPAEPAQRYSYD